MSSFMGSPVSKNDDEPDDDNDPLLTNPPAEETASDTDDTEKDASIDNDEDMLTRDNDNAAAEKF